MPPGTVGTHRHNGPVGMDFRVNSWVVVTELAAFDSGGDGFHEDITVTLWAVDTRKPITSVVFDKSDPGHLIGGLRYKTISPVLLPKVQDQCDTNVVF